MRLCLFVVLASVANAQISLRLSAEDGIFSLLTETEGTSPYSLMQVFLLFDPNQLTYLGSEEADTAWEFTDTVEARPGEISWTAYVNDYFPLAPNVAEKFYFSGTGCVILGRYDSCAGCPNFDLPVGYTVLPSLVYVNTIDGPVIVTDFTSSDCAHNCEGDWDSDGVRDLNDLTIVLSYYGTGMTIYDLISLLAYFGELC